MLAEELINTVVPSLQPEDSAGKALYWMDELHLSELPVIDHEAYRGLLTKAHAAVLSSETDSVAEGKLTGVGVFALPHQHFYDVLRIAEDHDIQMVAVVDEDQKFLGVVTVNDSLATFAQASTLQEPGGMLIISLAERDYSLSEIARLIESDNARILSSYVSADPREPERLKITLKINRLDLTRIVATLERFDYKIVARYQQIETTDTDKERLDMLMKYLNI
jgi:acetoin utilization protein AcuB